jgi:hypothetical protein
MSAGNPGIAAKDTKEETKSEREERILKEFIRGTTSIGFKIADESVEEILVSFSQELMHTIAKAEDIKQLNDDSSSGNNINCGSSSGSSSTHRQAEKKVLVESTGPICT